MLDKLANTLSLDAQALSLRGKRQEVLSSNITNADTPNYKAVDFDFAAALTAAASGSQAAQTPAGQLSVTHAKHFDMPAVGSSTDAMLKFREATSGSLDGNTVDIEYERAQFAENSVKYESALRKFAGNIKTLQTAITGGNNG